jgi:hypothetical protein
MGEYNWADPPKGVSYGNPNGVVNRGAYTPGDTYEVGDLIGYQGRLWLCVEDWVSPDTAVPTPIGSVGVDPATTSYAYPVGTQVGDIAVFAATEFSSAPAAPDGSWTSLLTGNFSGSAHLAAFFKTLTGTDITNGFAYTATNGGGVLYIVRGGAVDTANSYTGSTGLVSPTPTPADNLATVLQVIACTNNGTLSTPTAAGVSGVVEDGLAGYCATAIGNENYSGTSPVPARTWVWGTAGGTLPATIVVGAASGFDESKWL